jgi:hypothetical protein
LHRSQRVFTALDIFAAKEALQAGYIDADRLHHHRYAAAPKRSPTVDAPQTCLQTQ